MSENNCKECNGSGYKSKELHEDGSVTFECCNVCFGSKFFTGLINQINANGGEMSVGELQ